MKIAQVSIIRGGDFLINLEIGQLDGFRATGIAVVHGGMGMRGEGEGRQCETMKESLMHRVGVLKHLMLSRSQSLLKAIGIPCLRDSTDRVESARIAHRFNGGLNERTNQGAYFPRSLNTRNGVGSGHGSGTGRSPWFTGPASQRTS